MDYVKEKKKKHNLEVKIGRVGRWVGGMMPVDVRVFTIVCFTFGGYLTIFDNTNTATRTSFERDSTRRL